VPEEYWANAVFSLIPTLIVGLIFWFVMRGIFRADRTERNVYAQVEAEERARMGMPAAGHDGGAEAPGAATAARASASGAAGSGAAGTGAAGSPATSTVPAASDSGSAAHSASASAVPADSAGSIRSE
jgi:hypothetical protein